MIFPMGKMNEKWRGDGALWFRAAKSRDVSTGPLARPFAHSLVLLTHFLAQYCSFRSHSAALIRSLAPLLTHSRARGKVNDSMSQNDLVLTHSAAWRILDVNKTQFTPKGHRFVAWPWQTNNDRKRSSVEDTGKPHNSAPVNQKNTGKHLDSAPTKKSNSLVMRTLFSIKKIKWWLLNTQENPFIVHHSIKNNQKIKLLKNPVIAPSQSTMYQNGHEKNPQSHFHLSRMILFSGLTQLSRVVVPLVGMVMELFTFCYCRWQALWWRRSWKHLPSVVRGGSPSGWGGHESAHLLLLGWQCLWWG